MIFFTAYDTTVGSMTDLKNTEKMLKEALIKDLSYMNTFDLVKAGDISPVFITGFGSSEAMIPFFSHPLLMKADRNQDFMFCDVRPFMRQKMVGEHPSIDDIKNITEFQFSKARLVLNMAWCNGNLAGIRNDLAFAGAVFASWMSEVISKKYGLDPKDQLIVTIISHYYYQSLFEKEIDENTIQKFAVQTSRVTKAPTSMIFDVFDKIGDVSGIKSYCEAIINGTENIRMKDFNIGMLLSIISNSWYGHNSRDILPVALEHPPTWCAVVYTALVERTYKNFLISRVAERLSKHGQGDQFTKSFAGYIIEHTQHMTTEELFIREFSDA